MLRLLATVKKYVALYTLLKTLDKSNLTDTKVFCQVHKVH